MVVMDESEDLASNSPPREEGLTSPGSLFVVLYGVQELGGSTTRAASPNYWTLCARPSSMSNFLPAGQGGSLLFLLLLLLLLPLCSPALWGRRTRGGARKLTTAGARAGQQRDYGGTTEALRREGLRTDFGGTSAGFGRTPNILLYIYYYIYIN